MQKPPKTSSAHRQRMLQYRLDNPEKIKAAKREWYLKNKERILKKVSERAATQKDAKSLYDKARWKNNKEKLAEKARTYRRSKRGTEVIKARLDKNRALSETQPSRSMYDGMLGRCYTKTNPRYPYWGAVGIRVCDQWLGILGYRTFVKDLGPRPKGKDKEGRFIFTVDRIDSLGNYEPKNCRWASKEEQSRMRTKTIRRIRKVPNETLLYLDEKLTNLVDFSRKTGIHSDVVRLRCLHYPLNYNSIIESTDPERRYEFNGVKYTLYELFILSGYPEDVLRERIDVLQWPVEKAIKTSPSAVFE